jgi:hypothetical protein
VTCPKGYPKRRRPSGGSRAVTVEARAGDRSGQKIVRRVVLGRAARGAKIVGERFPRAAGGWKTTGRGRAAGPSVPCRRARARSASADRARTPIHRGAADEAPVTDVRGATSPNAIRIRECSGTKADRWFDAETRRADRGSRPRTPRGERQPTTERGSARHVLRIGSGAAACAGHNRGRATRGQCRSTREATARPARGLTNLGRLRQVLRLDLSEDSRRSLAQVPPRLARRSR